MSFETIQPLEIKKINKIIESKDVEQLESCLQNLELQSFSIGVGGNAEVFGIEDSHFSNVCLKKIKEKPQLESNDIDTEHQYQIDACKAGVRTPLTLISFETDTGKYFIMERIFGNTLEEVFARPSLLPEGFNVDSFKEELRSQIKKLHNAGIYHRDLHSRNVMVDTEGLPVIIDFGTATNVGSGGELTYSEMAYMWNEKKNKYESVFGYYKDDVTVSLRSLEAGLNGIKQNLTK